MNSVGYDPRPEQVRRILQSRTFRNTEVLKRLLDYLGKQAVNDPEGEIKEYTLGVEAFGKPSDYDPQTDSSVRVQVGKLRQKLDEYYRTEGTSDSLVVALPKGHFKLEFRPQAPVATASSPRPPAPRQHWVVPALIVILAAAAIYWFARPRPAATASLPGDWNSDMEAFWKPFLTGSRPTMIAIGAPLFTKIGGDFFRSPGVNTWDSASQSEEVRSVTKALGKDDGAPAYPYTGVGEAKGAFELQRLLLLRGREPSLQVSSLLTWDDITRCNMIFLGPPKYNLQTIDLPVRQDFEISHARVHNLHPAAGETVDFEEKWNPDRWTLLEGHALITRIPGLHRTGEMLILAGSSTECTRAAVEFVTRPECVAPFLRFLRSQPGGIPDWFQVVIRAQFKSQTPIAIERVAFHALK